MCSTHTSHPNFQPPLFTPSHSPHLSPPILKLCLIFTQFTKSTQIHFDTDFDAPHHFPSKTKLSDNLKTPKITHFHLPASLKPTKIKAPVEPIPKSHL